MISFLPDVLKTSVSTIANVVLMMTLHQPKYSKKATLLTMIVFSVIDLGSSVVLYIYGDLTLLTKLDIVLFTILCFAIRPMFKDTFMQWLFSFLTIQNINLSVVIISYLISWYLPFPQFANIVLRLILFSAIIFLLKRYVRPLYRQVVEQWTAYFLVSMSIALTFAYYVLSTIDIVAMVKREAVSLLLVISIGSAAYVSIFLSLYNLRREYALKDENQLMQSEQEYFRLYAKSMTERIKLMDEAVQQYRIAAHDRRHFSNMLLGLLKQGRSSDAMVLLEKQSHVAPLDNRSYCENSVINAAVSYYVSMAEKAGIKIEIALDLPRELMVDEVEFAMLISNLMENAIHGCEALDDNVEKYLRLTCHSAGRMLMEIENSCALDVLLDENGLPKASDEDHGTGTRSVLAIVRKYHGELLYRIEHGVFRVRLLI